MEEESWEDDWMEGFERACQQGAPASEIEKRAFKSFCEQVIHSRRVLSKLASGVVKVSPSEGQAFNWNVQYSPQTADKANWRKPLDNATPTSDDTGARRD